jgi:hypothetical protein
MEQFAIDFLCSEPHNFLIYKIFQVKKTGSGAKVFPVILSAAKNLFPIPRPFAALRVTGRTMLTQGSKDKNAQGDRDNKHLRATEIRTLRMIFRITASAPLPKKLGSQDLQKLP